MFRGKGRGVISGEKTIYYRHIKAVLKSYYDMR